MDHFDQNFSDLKIAGGGESFGAALSGLALTLVSSPYIIPFAGFTLGCTTMSLAIKLKTKYNIVYFNKIEENTYKLVHGYTKLKIISFLFCMVIANNFPVWALGISLSIGAISAIEMAQLTTIYWKKDENFLLRLIKKVSCLFYL